MTRADVFYLITKSERGGAQSHLAELLSGFRGRLEMALGVGTEGPLTEHAERLGIPVTVIPELVGPVSPRRDPAAWRRIRKQLAEDRPRLLHCHSSKAGTLGRLAAAGLDIPALFTAHGWAFTEGASPVRRALALIVERFLAHRSARLITVSAYDRDLALRYRVAERERMTVIRNGITDTGFPVSTVTGEKKSRSGPLQAIMVARFAPPKRQVALIKALAGVEHPVALTLVGDGPERREAERLAARAPSRHEIRFAGERDDVPELLARHDLFVLCSRYEGLPVSILEAMRAGLPVVASDVGAISECVEPGETGLLVPGGDRHALAAAIGRLAADASQRKSMGERGRALFLERFTAGRMLHETLEVYRFITGDRGFGST